MDIGILELLLRGIRARIIYDTGEFMNFCLNLNGNILTIKDERKSI